MRGVDSIYEMISKIIAKNFTICIYNKIFNAEFSNYLYTSYIYKVKNNTTKSDQKECKETVENWCSDEL